MERVELRRSSEVTMNHGWLRVGGGLVHSLTTSNANMTGHLYDSNAEGLGRRIMCDRRRRSGLREAVDCDAARGVTGQACRHAAGRPTLSRAARLPLCDRGGDSALVARRCWHAGSCPASSGRGATVAVDRYITMAVKRLPALIHPSSPSQHPLPDSAVAQRHSTHPPRVKRRRLVWHNVLAPTPSPSPKPAAPARARSTPDAALSPPHTHAVRPALVLSGSSPAP